MNIHNPAQIAVALNELKAAKQDEWKINAAVDRFKWKVNIQVVDTFEVEKLRKNWIDETPLLYKTINHRNGIFTLKRLSDNRTVICKKVWKNLQETYDDPLIIVSVENDGNNYWRYFSGESQWYIRDCLKWFTLTE